MKRLKVLRLGLIAKGMLAVALLSCSLNALATTSTWKFRSSNNGDQAGQLKFSTNSKGSDFYHGNSATMTVNGITLNINAWSDTGDVYGDDKVQSATLYNNSYGLLNYNRDELKSYQNGDHYIDNKTSGNDPDGDVDMLLFSFSEAVSLTSLWFGSSFESGGSNKRPDVSIAAFDESPLPTLAGNTWSSIANHSSNLFKTSINNLASGSGLSLMANNAVVESKYWLVGAYDSVFGNCCKDGLHDGFKLSKLTTHASDKQPPPDHIDAPSNTIAMFTIFLLFNYYRKAVKSRFPSKTIAYA